MKKILLLFFITFPLLGFSQSYVFCPEIKTEQKQGFEGLYIFIVFKDSRVYEEKLIEKCTKNEIFSEFVNCIKNTFSDIKITVLDENKYDENPIESAITFKIDLQKYDATAHPGVGVYIANTKYEVILFDNRKGVNIFKDTITGEGKQINALGYKSGKIASNSSFKRAFDKFILMFENFKPPLRVDGFTSDEALVELKRFKEKLDLQLITQEEYDKKKVELMKYIR